jgi:hypothetical protein
MKTSNILPYLLLVVMGWLLYLQYQNSQALKENKESLEYWQKEGFKTDTVKVQSVYNTPQNIYPNYVGPKNYYSYLDDTSSNILKYLDSVLQVNDSLGKTLATINSQYIKKFPTKPKLIYGEFKQDSLRLDFLEISGEVHRYDYLVNFRRFNYQWVDSLRAMEKSFTPSKPVQNKAHFMGLYANTGYDFLLKQPVVSADINWGYKKFRLGGELKSTINNEPQLFGNVKLGFRVR